MKKFFLLVLPIIVLVTLALKPYGELPIGADIPKPDLKMKDINGGQVSFKDAKKKNGLLVIFTCNTCPVARGYQSRMKEVCKYALENNIGVILLNSNEALRDEGDSFQDMQDFAKEHSYEWYYVVDQNSVMADAFDAGRTPECFLFNAEIKLTYHGAIDDNAQNKYGVSRHHLKEAIDQMVAGKDITIKITRSVGCSIKRL